MGILYFERDEDASHLFIRLAPLLDKKSNTPVIVDPWLIALIVVGSLIITILAVFLLAHYIKSRRRHDKEFQPVTSMASPYLRVRKVSSDDRRKAEELQRDAMIWKSLATRPLSAVSTRSSQGLPTPDRSSHSGEEQPEEQGETAGLKEDWKAWEARVLTERRYSGPGVGLDQHPAFASHLSGTRTNLRAVRT